jgi:hypothetical protein
MAVASWPLKVAAWNDDVFLLVPNGYRRSAEFVWAAALAAGCQSASTQEPTSVGLRHQHGRRTRCRDSDQTRLRRGSQARHRGGVGVAVVPAVGIVTAVPHLRSDLRIIHRRYGRCRGGGQAALTFRRWIINVPSETEPGTFTRTPPNCRSGPPGRR